MNRIFPIRVEQADNKKYKIIEWMLGNTCNYNCSFCPDKFKSGSQKFLDIDIYKKIIDKAVRETPDKKIWFKLTGGEPTLYPKLIELCTYIKQTNNFVYIISNGSRTLRWWNELKLSNSVDIIALSYHPEQTTNYFHIVDIINLFRDTKTLVNVNITTLPNFFQEAINSFEYITQNSETLTNLGQINDTSGMSKYTPEQKRIFLEKTMKNSLKNNLKNNEYHIGKVTYTYNDNTQLTDYSHNFIKRQENNFFNYECDAGKDFIRIEYTEIQRAICGVGEKWNIYDEKLFSDNSVICDKTVCDCTLDLLQTKKINT